MYLKYRAKDYKRRTDCAFVAVRLLGLPRVVRISLNHGKQEQKYNNVNKSQIDFIKQMCAHAAAGSHPG